MDFRYPKETKLKSRTTISRLFTEGASVSKFPLRLVFVRLEESGVHQVGVSVSKKYFKRAVDRNYFKRVLRETYRTNQNLVAGMEGGFAFMLFYQTADRLAFAEIESKMKSLLEKFAETTREISRESH